MKIYVFLISLLTQTITTTTQALQLQDLLLMSRKQSSEHRAEIAEKMVLQESIIQLNKHYEPTWQSRVFHDSDQLLTQQRFSTQTMTSLTTTGLDTKWLQKNPYGTEFYIQFELQKFHAFWPEGVNIPSNKSYTSTGRIGVQQPLLKDFLSRTTSLQKENIETQVSQKSILKEANNQQRQYQVEQLYWQAFLLKNQISISTEKENLSDEYIKLIKKRQSLGLADDVALAEAIRQQISAKTFKIQRQHDFERTWERLLISGELPPSLKSTEISWISPDQVHQHFFLSDSEFLKESLLQNLSLQTLQSQRESQHIQLQIIREQHRPDLKLGIEGSIGGQGTSIADSTTDLQHKSTFYISFQIPLSGQSLHSQTQGVQFQLKAISEREKHLKHQFTEETKQILSERKRLEQQIDLAQENLTALENLKKAEQKKISQARSDRVLIIRYEIDALDLKSQFITLLAEKQKIFSKMRFFVNAYPTGVETL